MLIYQHRSDDVLERISYLRAEIQQDMRLTLTAILSVLTILQVQAQQGYELGGWVGTSWYFGDLNNNNSFSMPGLAGGVTARYDFDERVSLRGGASLARVRADDAVLGNEFEQKRNLHFRSMVWEGHLAGEFNFMPYVHGSRNHRFTPHIFGGFVVFGYNPQAELDGRWVDLQPYGTEGQELNDEYYAVSMAWLLGGGIKFDISQNLSVNIEWGGRFTGTDYLDDVSGVYPDKDALLRRRGADAVRLSDPSTSDPQIGATGRQRGNSKDNDSYHFFSIGIMRFFGGIKCPPVSREY